MRSRTISARFEQQSLTRTVADRVSEDAAQLTLLRRQIAAEFLRPRRSQPVRSLETAWRRQEVDAVNYRYNKTYGLEAGIRTPIPASRVGLSGLPGPAAARPSARGLTCARARATLGRALQDASRPRKGPSPPDCRTHTFDLLSARRADAGASKGDRHVRLPLRVCPRVRRWSNSASKPKICCARSVPATPPPRSAFARCGARWPIQAGRPRRPRGRAARPRSGIRIRELGSLAAESRLAATDAARRPARHEHDGRPSTGSTGPRTRSSRASRLSEKDWDTIFDVMREHGSPA